MRGRLSVIISFGKTETVSYQSFEEHEFEVLGFGLKANTDYFQQCFSVFQAKDSFWGCLYRLLLIRRSVLRKLINSRSHTHARRLLLCSPLHIIVELRYRCIRS